MDASGVLGTIIALIHRMTRDAHTLEQALDKLSAHVLDSYAPDHPLWLDGYEQRLREVTTTCDTIAQLAEEAFDALRPR